MPLFGKQTKATPAPVLSETILKLKETDEMLDKRVIFLNAKIEAETTKIKTLMKNHNKRTALQCLKKRKQLEIQREKVEGFKLSIEQQLLTLENATVTKATVQAMKDGNESLKNLHKDMNVDSVDNTMDEITEELKTANIITDEISKPIGMNEFMDDDELLEELDTLEQGELDNKLLQINVPTSLGVKSKEKNIEEEQLKLLEASMM